MSRGEQIFVEVGCGWNPVPLRGGRDFTKDLYYGFDKNMKVLSGPKGVRNLTKVAHPSYQAEYIQLSATDEWPFEDGQVDEVFMANFVGDPSVKEADKVLKRAYDALADDGQLTILETYTPPALGIINRLLTGSRLVTVELVTGTDGSWENRTAPYYIKAPRRNSASKVTLLNIAKKIS
jgi:hypothetical protein